MDSLNQCESSGTVVESEVPFDEKKVFSRTDSMGSYPKLSRFMSSWPDVAIFRRFGTLNAENLLLLQAEISHLEDRLQRQREEQRRSEKSLLKEQNWHELSQPINEDGDFCDQYETMLEIRDKLKEYSKCPLHE